MIKSAFLSTGVAILEFMLITIQDFWFANWTVGAADDLLLLIDTGSTDVYLNPGIYVPVTLPQTSMRTSPSPSLQRIPMALELRPYVPALFGTSHLTNRIQIVGQIYKDVVQLDGTRLSVPQQPLGVTPLSSQPGFPHDGLVGFGGPGSAINGSAWVQDLCAEGGLDQCRFGLALETDDTGVQYFGTVEHSRFDGALSVAPLFQYEGSPIMWALFGDIAYNGKVIVRDAEIASDSGTTVIFGPVDDVAALFDAAGLQYLIVNSTNPAVPTTLTGYYPCDQPPPFGFGFPSISNATTASENGNRNVSHESTVFNVLPSQLLQNGTGNNCTASIHGTDEFGGWIVGQAFFQGKYVESQFG
ncbi:hypothetical protein D0Z07_7451 [Hyphodiscus hymeniophilus]|uniref:Peptidase A1 domain-containing protein n=1 Tax=Hyphodiscus hymeniophilus TaxID=353542 RepID=A0A9P6VEP7_9HELO|nr:hypothetical protein D0Z07_7451 [Hyphodiscus hymeniophilus]